MAAMLVKRRPHFLEQEHEVGGFGGVLRVLPVDVQPVETEVFEQLDSARGEALAACFGRCGLREVGGVGPAADGEEDFEAAVALLEQVELLYAAVDVGAHVVPGVGRVVLFDVGPGVC